MQPNAEEQNSKEYVYDVTRRKKNPEVNKRIATAISALRIPRQLKDKLEENLLTFQE